MRKISKLINRIFRRKPKTTALDNAVKIAQIIVCFAAVIVCVKMVFCGRGDNGGE